jgi:transforming growth factor-beta-induced protein
MRKILLVIAALMLAVVPAFAQDATAEPMSGQTIGELAMGNADLSTLVAAVQAADPAFLQALTDANANLTVFAPTNAAFEELLKNLNVSAEQLLGNKALLDVVLAYHVVPAKFDAAAVTKLDGALVGTVLPENALTIKVADGKVMVNDATVTAADVMASNGIVHVIDKVLVPADAAKLAEEMSMMMEATPDAMAAAPMSIAETVVASTTAATPEFTTLLAAVQAADPAVLATLSGAGEYTVFAPTDAAFAAALTSLNTTAEALLADQANLTNILLYHVVPGKFSAATVIAAAGASADGVKVATLLPGTTVTLKVVDGKVMVNDATVAAADVAVSNGVVHVIDQVILPPQS